MHVVRMQFLQHRVCRGCFELDVWVTRCRARWHECGGRLLLRCMLRLPTLHEMLGQRPQQMGQQACMQLVRRRVCRYCSGLHMQMTRCEARWHGQGGCLLMRLGCIGRSGRWGGGGEQ